MIPLPPDPKEIEIKYNLEEIKLRDEFAIEILKQQNINNLLDHNVMVHEVYYIAELMIKERKKYL